MIVIIGDAVRDRKVRELHSKLMQKSRAYLDRSDLTGLHSAAEVFARRCLSEAEDTIDFVVRRDNRILQAASGAIWRGPVFRADFAGIQGVGDDERDNPSSGRPRRIFQFIDLWNDCNG